MSVVRYESFTRIVVTLDFGPDGRLGAASELSRNRAFHSGIP